MSCQHPSIIGLDPRTVIIPDGDPRKLLMAQQEVQVGPICGMTLAVVVQSIDLAIWKRNSSDAVAPAIIPVGVLVQIVSQMEDVVHRIFSHRMSVCVEVGKRVIAARIDGEANFGD